MDSHTSTDADIDAEYFWKKNRANGFLSQWYTVEFTAPAHPASKNQELMTFTSAEQYMMYHKAMAFQDLQIAEQIMELSDPGQQKARGRQIKGFNEEIWIGIKESIVEDGNWWKFTAARDERQRQCLRSSLLRTGERVLVEASPFDNIWGIGYRIEYAELNRPYWGLNLLGKALMKVRSRIREESEQCLKGTATRRYDEEIAQV